MNTAAGTRLSAERRTSILALSGAFVISAATGVGVLAVGAAEGFAACIVLGLLVVYGCTMLVTVRRESRLWNPVTLFFTFAIAHAFLGYLSAAPTTIYLYHPTSGIYGVFEKSLLIVSTGLAAIMCGYMTGLCRAPRKAFEWSIRHLRSLSFETITRRSRAVLIAGLPAIAFIFWQLGEIPLFTPDPGRARFLQFLKPEFRELVWLQNRCIDSFQIAVPCLIVALIRRRKPAQDLVLIALAVFSAIAVVQRGPVISILVTSAVALLSGRRLKLLIAAAPAFLFLYLGTQYFIMNWNSRLESSLVFELYGQALPEVRDLSWFLSSLGDRHLWGITFLHALIPLPGFLAFEQIKLRNITFQAIGLPLDAANGGIRILFSGECYANFGYVGVIVFCFIYGLFCGWVSTAFQTLRETESRFFGGLFVLAAMWVLLSFWLYLGGTNASGVIRFQLLVLLFLAWPRRRAPQGGTAP